MQMTQVHRTPSGRGPTGLASTVTTDRLVEAAATYAKYAYMYIEYPHKSFWSPDFSDRDLTAALSRLREPGESLMLYVHFPFCRRQCFYCTCHTEISHDYDRYTAYLSLLMREMDLYQRTFEAQGIRPKIVEVHLGGGSPTLLREPQFDALVDRIRAFTGPAPLREFAIEVDPRNTDKERLHYYHSKGINRISLGVQDFDPEVQKAINRIQPLERVAALLSPEVRALFPHGVNFDMLCGLPRQTPQGVRRSFETLAALAPDRVCFNSLHFAPDHARHQRIMVDGKAGRPLRLPDPIERKILFREGMQVLLDHGYVRTGYDHFARPEDEVARALNASRMRWNALGVTAGEYSHVLGVGPHSTSTLFNTYAQNVYGTRPYQDRLSQGRFPVFRGYVLSREDEIRRDVIQGIRNFSCLHYADVEARHGIDFQGYFGREIESLDGCVRDGLVELTDADLRVTDLGREFVLVVCSHFDAYANH